MSDDRNDRVTDDISITTDPDKADVLVCLRYTAPGPMILPDNALGACSVCKHAVQFRPDVPAQLRKLCIECAIQMVRRH